MFQSILSRSLRTSANGRLGVLASKQLAVLPRAAWPLQSPTTHDTVAQRFFADEAATPGVIQVPIQEAQATTAQALKMIGWDDEDANLQAEIMTAAEVCGNNQGLVKMYQPEMMAPAPTAGKPEIERETSNSAVVNAHQAPGMLAAVTAADMAMEKLASSNGNSAISIVSSYNSSTSSGQLAFYVERMARKGYIGIAMANSPEMVAAAQGGKPVFGTNPMAIGVPQKGTFPFVVCKNKCVRVARFIHLPNLTNYSPLVVRVWLAILITRSV